MKAKRFSSIREKEGGLGETTAYVVLHNRNLQHGFIWKFRGLWRGQKEVDSPIKG
jgi:hypothetical protein